MEELIEELNNFVDERMNKPLMELDKQPFMKKRKNFKEELYEEILEVINKTDKEKEKTFENLIGEIDLLSSYHEEVYYIVGLLDGIKLQNMFK